MNKENAHLYLPLVQALVDGNDVQQIRGEGWLNIKDPTLVREPECYRIKPATILINGIEVPEPVREPLNNGDKYSLVVLGRAVDDIEWASDGWDMENLRDGLIHLTKESAEIHRKALLSFTAKEEAQ